MRSPRLTTVAAMFACLAAPALAQEQTTPPSPANQAANVREQPVTDALNGAVQSNLAVQAEITAEQRGQYEIDRAQYRAAVRDRAAIVGADKARYMRQEDAYARAMIAWRVQTGDCKRGILKSCKKPTPMPADFY